MEIAVEGRKMENITTVDSLNNLGSGQPVAFNDCRLS